MCLQCFRLLKEIPGPLFTCACGFQLCSARCSKGDRHEVECQVYQRAGRLAGSLVGPIRLLHAMKDPVQSERLTRMMDHVEGMRKETGRLLRSMSSSRSSVWESPSQRSIFM